MQALHFFIGLGALLSPLIADPFLSEFSLSNNSTENATAIPHHFRMPVIHDNSAQSVPVEGKPRVQYAFWIMALINLPVPIAVFVLIYQEKLLSCCPSSTPRLLDKDELAMETKAQRDGTEKSETASEDSGGHGNLFSCCMNDNLRGLPVTFFVMHILGGIVLFMTEGIMGIYAGFVYTYAVSVPMSLHAKMAAYLNCVFWAAITAGRLVSIPLSYRFKPVYLLIINLAGVNIILLLLLIFNTNSVFLFVGTSFLGLFLSSIFPCLLAYTEDILNYQGCATAVLVATAQMGEMSMQVLVGSLIQAKGSFSFLVCGLLLSSVALLVFLILIVCNHFHKKLTGTSKKASIVEDPSAFPPPEKSEQKIPVT